MIEFGRDICSDLENSMRREWLVTNGTGSYACGTIAGANTRCYHGVLIAALAAPVARTLLVSKIDATAHLRGTPYPLDTNEWADNSIEPAAYKLIESFQLDDTIPTWTFALAEAQLVKRVWMVHGHDTTFVAYTHTRGHDPIDLDLKVLCTYRDHHNETQGDWTPNIMLRPDSTSLRVDAFEGAVPYFVKVARGTYKPIDHWYRKFKHRVETERGLDDIEDLYAAGTFHATLQPGETIALVATTEEEASLDWQAALAAEQQRARSLIAQSGLEGQPAWIQQLGLAADQFIVDRHFGPDCGKTVIAGYHWFSDWGRDTMIALPGLCLTTRRYDVAKTILKTFAAFVDQGMLPNRFPDQGEQPEYNTVDATLWYFHAIDAVVTATDDWALARELYPILKDIVAWHLRGTRYHIHVDEDGLLYAGESGVQLTWMDAKVDEWVVTPRIGKPVEINTLWIHALRIMAYFAHQLGYKADTQAYIDHANRATDSFTQRYWYGDGGYLYDVIDGPHGSDASLRPNQLLAVSLKPALLPHDTARSVVDVCAKQLATSYGLRSLAPTHEDYTGIFTGDRYARDGAYHQGTVWSWLIGPFVEAHYTVYRNRTAALSYLRPFALHLNDLGLGSISEVFDGNAPHLPRGCAAQAWSVAEVLRMWMNLTNEK
jgi:predicted glycogen debranching enzyme